jgi:hypothetical protein
MGEQPEELRSHRAMIRNFVFWRRQIDGRADAVSRLGGFRMIDCQAAVRSWLFSAVVLSSAYVIAGWPFNQILFHSDRNNVR